MSLKQALRQWHPSLLGVALLTLACGLMGWLVTQTQEERRLQQTLRTHLELVTAQAQERLTELESRLYSESQAQLSDSVALKALTQKLQQEFPFLMALETRDRQGQLVHGGVGPSTSGLPFASGQLALLESALLTGRAEYRLSEASRHSSNPTVSLIVPARRNEADSWFATVNLGQLTQDLAASEPKRWPHGIKVGLTPTANPNALRPEVVVDFSRGGLKLGLAATRPGTSLAPISPERSLIALLAAAAGLIVGLWLRGLWLNKQALAANQELEDKMQASAKIATLGEMSAAIAHELNQPLGAIENYAHACERLLRRAEPTPPGVLEALSHIRHEAQRGAEVIRSIRSLARRERGRIERVNISELFVKLRPLLEIQARRYSCEITMNAEPSLAVVCERTLLEQVIVNLTNNGFEAMQETPKLLRQLNLSARLDPLSRAVVMVVSDNGPGVTDSDASSLFKPFFTTKTEGLGIGLNLCQTIAEQQGGSIVWRNKDERGAEFILRLPVAPSAEAG